MSDAHLHLEGYSTILFNDGTYRWFDEHQYRICRADAITTDRELLANLIAQPSYESSAPLLSPSRSGSPRADLENYRKQLLERDRTHGPYLLRCVTPQAFEVIDAPGARQRLMAWGQIDGDGIPPKGLHEVERLTETARAATGLYWLQDLDAGCVLPWNYFGAWAELVIVDRRRDEVLLVIASAD